MPQRLLRRLPRPLLAGKVHYAAVPLAFVSQGRPPLLLSAGGRHRARYPKGLTALVARSAPQSKKPPDCSGGTFNGNIPS